MLNEGVSDSAVEFVPYYEGFRGTVTPSSEPNKFLIRGLYERATEDKVRITELPVGTWTMPYITFLETLADGVVDNEGGLFAIALVLGLVFVAVGGFSLLPPRQQRHRH